MATLPEITEALNLTPQRVNQLAKEGVLPRESRGSYDLVACLMAYVRYLQQAVTSRATMDDDGEVVTTKNAKAQLTQYQADLKKLELAKARGQVIAVADVEAMLSTLIIETKARVMAIAPRVAPRILGQTSRLMVQATIEEETKLALTELAQRTPLLPPPAGTADAAPAAKRARKPAAKKRTKRRPAKTAKAAKASA